jgi:hypothetical protein
MGSQASKKLLIVDVKCIWQLLFLAISKTANAS